MQTVIQVLASAAIGANAVVHGTEIFGAVVLRPAIAAVEDRTLTQLLGHVHRVADRWFGPIGAGGLNRRRGHDRARRPVHRAAAA